MAFTSRITTEALTPAADYVSTKAGDVVILPYFGKVLLTGPMYAKNRQGDTVWVAPGYRWIKSKQKFSGNSLLSQFGVE